jgi:hypothetical protein
MLCAPWLRVVGVDMPPDHLHCPATMADETDYDRHRQEAVWRILSADRQALLRFCQRLGVTVGQMDSIKTLRSDKPLLQLIAHGHDADTIAKWARGRS